MPDRAPSRSRRSGPGWPRRFSGQILGRTWPDRLAGRSASRVDLDLDQTLATAFGLGWRHLGSACAPGIKGGYMLRTLSAMLGILLVTTACGESLQSASLTTPPPAPPPPIRAWLVFFDTNSSTLSEQANMTVRAAADVARTSASSKVEVTGYTDTEG